MAMSMQQLREYVRYVEQSSEKVEKAFKEHGVEDDSMARFPSVILVMPGMLVSGPVVSSRNYNQHERTDLEQLHRELALEGTETVRSIADRLMGFLFLAPTPDEAEAMLEEDYEPQTIYLLDVTIIMGDGATELSGIAVEFDQVLGWKLGQLIESDSSDAPAWVEPN
jgi:hypothetical protein